jgi:hypothetical protein
MRTLPEHDNNCATRSGQVAVTRRTRREARLKPEFAHLYPPLKAGQWGPAGTMANKLIAWVLGTKKHDYVSSERVLREEHFEFRGGERSGSDQ